MAAAAARGRCTWRVIAGEGGHAITPLLASVQLANAIAMALPLTACGLLVVRDVGFGAHPEWLIAYDASMFAPSFAGVLFGLLSDCVPIGCRRVLAGRSSRMRWVMIGMAGSGSCLIPFAAGAVRSPGPLFTFGIGGSIFTALTASSIEGVMVERGREVAAHMCEGDALAFMRVRSAVQALDYQVRGVGALVGYSASAALLSVFPPSSAIAAGAACYVVAGLLASQYARTAARRTSPAAEPAGAQGPAASTFAAAASEADAGAQRTRATSGSERKCVDLRQGARAPKVHVALLAALAAFVYQLAPTLDDTYDAYLYSGAVQGLSPSILSISSTASLLMSMVVAPALCVRLPLPAPAAFALGALADALGGLVRLVFVRLAPSVSAMGGPAQVSCLLVADSCAAALLGGIAFVPVVALAALAAPAGAEATVFGFVLTAQTAGSLAAASVAAMLTARLEIGMPAAAALGATAVGGSEDAAYGSGLASSSNRSALAGLDLTAAAAAAGAVSGDSGAGDARGRTWDRLPEFILLCSALKLLVLLPVLPLLRVCMRLVADQSGGGGASGPVARHDETLEASGHGGDWRQPLSEPLLASVADTGQELPSDAGVPVDVAAQPLDVTPQLARSDASEAGEEARSDDSAESLTPSG